MCGSRGSEMRAMMRGGLLLAILVLARAGAASDVEGWGYAVVVHEETYARPEWKAVVEALKVRHGASVVVYDDGVEGALGELRRLFPRYACFVGRHEEITREFVGRVHRLTRRLDEDPYTDLIWGVITGYDAADALRIARHDEPLVVRRALSATVGAQVDAYDEGRMYDELSAGTMHEKVRGVRAEPRPCGTDTTADLVEALNSYGPDVFVTSGHATERDWQIGYSYRNGYFRCAGGQWYGIDTQKRRFDINSANPKVFMGIGNCLIAHIPDRECMALAMMRTGGVYQFVGYTIPTGYGYGGWGVKDYFSELQAGRFTLAEANYVNNQALVYELERRGMNTERDPGRGLRGDRDVVVLYGDPAWEARMPKRRLPWTQELLEEDGVYTFTIRANERGDWDNRPVVHLLPGRVENVRVIEGEGMNPVVTDNFILVPVRDELLPMKANRGEVIPLRGDFEAGDVLRVVFRADRIGARGAELGN